MLCYVMLCYVCRERESTSIRKKKSGGSGQEMRIQPKEFFEQVPKGKWAGNPWVFYISDPVLGHRMHMPRGQPTKGTLRYSPFHFLLAKNYK